MLCVFQIAIWGCCMIDGIVFKQCSGDDMYDVCVSDGSMEKLYGGKGIVCKQCSGDDVCVSGGSMEELYVGRGIVFKLY